MKQIVNTVVVLSLLLAGTLSFAQVRFKATVDAQGLQHIYREEVAGTGRYTIPVSTLPSDAVQSRKAGRVLLPYAPSAKKVLNRAQFGLDKYYSPNFHFQIDFGGWESVDARRRYGENTFGFWNILDEHRSQLRGGEGFLFLTENFLTDQAYGHSFNFESFQTFVTKAYDKVPSVGYGVFANIKYMTFNIETPLYMNPGNYNAPALPGWDAPGWYGHNGNPSWDEVKNNVIPLEASRESITLAQLAARGPAAWLVEQQVRLANRYTFLVEAAKRKRAPGALISSGSPMRISQPNKDDMTAGSLWINSDCNVSNIGGDSQGNITVNLPSGQQWSVRINNTLNDHEDWCNLPVGRGFTEFPGDMYNQIFVSKTSGFTTEQQIWNVEKPMGIVAEVKGLLQHQRQRMRTRLQTHQVKGMVREKQLFLLSADFKLPFPDMQNIQRFGDPNFLETPWMWFAPYHMYSDYATTRFMAGDDADWGWHLFPQSQYDTTKDPLTFSDSNYGRTYNRPFHPIEALYQARADMQPYESFFAGTTLIEDPEVQANGTGDFVAYNGIVAYDQYPKPQLPAYMIRYKALPDNSGWRVLIIGGMQQGWTDERTDVIRVPGGGLNGNKFKVKLRGPAAQLYEFVVKQSDSGQMYEALPIAQTTWERPAYAGRTSASDGVIVTPTPTPTTSTLSFNILGYNCTSGSLQYSASSPGASPITLSIIGISSGIVTSGQTLNYTAPQDARTNVTYKGSLKQAGYSDISLSFTLSCSTVPISYTSTSTTPDPTPIPTPVPVPVTGGLAYDYPVPVTPGAWPAYNSDVLSGKVIGEVARLESAQITVEARKNYGGSIQITDKASGKKLVDWTDWGRQNEVALYGGPQNFSKDGWPNFNGIGWNPLTAGDMGQNPGKVLAWGYVTGNDNKQRLYIKSQGISWPHFDARHLEVTFERWIGVTGGEVDVLYRATTFRADKTYYEARSIQFPCFMRPGIFNKVKFYAGDNPYTNDNITFDDYPMTGSSYLDYKSFEGGTVRISEPWIDMEQDGVHIFMNTETLGETAPYVESPSRGNDTSEGSFSMTECDANVYFPIDPNYTRYHRYGFYVTSNFNEGRAWANARPRKHGDVPDFKFNQANGRCEWRVENGYDQQQPFTSDGWIATLVPSADGGPMTSRRSVLKSPVGIWKSSLVPKLYVRLRYSGQESQLRISYKKNGQADQPVSPGREKQWAGFYPKGFTANDQSFLISPIKDSQYHTYEINTNSNPYWAGGVIQQFMISHGPGDSALPQENIDLLYFGVNNPGN